MELGFIACESIELTVQIARRGLGILELGGRSDSAAANINGETLLQLGSDDCRSDVGAFRLPRMHQPMDE